MTLKVLDIDMNDVLWVKHSRDGIKICARVQKDAEKFAVQTEGKPDTLYSFEDCTWNTFKDDLLYSLDSIIPYIGDIFIFHFKEFKSIKYGNALSRIETLINVDTDLLETKGPIFSVGIDPEDPDVHEYEISVPITDLVDITEATKRFAVGVTANIFWNTGTRNGQITSVQISNGELIIKFEQIFKGDYLTLDIRQFIRKV